MCFVPILAYPLSLYTLKASVNLPHVRMLDNYLEMYVDNHLLWSEGPYPRPDSVFDPPDCAPDAEDGLAGVVVEMVDGQQLLVAEAGVLLLSTHLMTPPILILIRGQGWGGAKVRVTISLEL